MFSLSSEVLLDDQLFSPILLFGEVPSELLQIDNRIQFNISTRNEP
jgi:hypothetical protein